MTSWFYSLQQENGPYNNSVCIIPPQMSKLSILQGMVLLVIWAMKTKKNAMKLKELSVL